jgi:hypothetical protein
MANKIVQFYQDEYARQSFSHVYLEERMDHYANILRIIKKLNVSSIIDIGCSFGKLVELCNKSGISSYGIDLPIENLKQYHARLTLSRDKIFYGIIGRDDFLNIINENKIDTAIISDTLRYIEHPEKLNGLKFNYIIIKEISKKFCELYYRLRQKRQIPWHYAHLYSPAACLELFQDYYPYEIYCSKHLVRVSRPGRLTLSVINILSPTFTLVLKRKT